MAVAMAIGSFVCDSLGMKRMLGLAFLCHLVGTVGTLGTPYLAGMGVSPYFMLCIVDVPGREREWAGRDRDQPAGRDALSVREDA